MYATTASGLVRAPRSAVYAALLDPAAVSRWRVPDDMSAEVHEWSAVEGGRFRVSLAYADASRSGKTAGNVDTYAGRFVRLVPDEEVVEELAFESADPALAGAMTMTWTLADAAGGTEVTLVHDGVPDAVSAADNETGTRMALAHLAAYVEGLV
ncbi:polyketide cyclase [Nocardioides anomalus]|uniref:Polyketide cyclase n=1 Tax=Nocardioides anomalus TaxID=2712223 RepID=A0A6G6WGF5_9ACTN|nr:SRPBCC domain-containing protein [Nocardioides anomalus]QIG44237.1 polyketide cyclase [Nocardioides anomalus]